MELQNKQIDGGKAFDWGRTSEDYAKYRDIYPPVFYEKIVSRGLCVKGQTVLDIGTGTGVLPRNLYTYGADWTGTDISEAQIIQAKRLAKKADMQIHFAATATEALDFPDNCFDVITACQCFWYFDHAAVMPKLARMLKPGGKLLLLYMAWLPYEDAIAGASEKLVLRYSPNWSGAGETKKPIPIPDVVLETFQVVDHEEYDLAVPFTRASWHGRMKACRGVGASLSEAELERWDAEHRQLLNTIAPAEFMVRHYAALTILQTKRAT